MYILYDLIFILFALFYLPYMALGKKFHNDFWQRLGFFSKEFAGSWAKGQGARGGCIWLHAVSVGEVVAIRPFWNRLRKEFPSKGIVVSTVTRTGNEMAKRFANGTEKVFYLPLDISFIVTAVLQRVRPSALILAETEIWPNLIDACRRLGIPVILINGRISDRAFKRYRLVTPFLRGIFNGIRVFCVRSAEDENKFIALNAPRGRIRVCGNMKYSDMAADGKDEAAVRRAFAIDERETVFTAGSTHKGEEEALVWAYDALKKEFPRLRLIIAPRHVERAGEINRLKGDRAITVVGAMGALKDLYRVSDIVFVGGSLVRHGGHNIIEPAMFAKPILFGPHMFNFKDVADEFLKNNAGISVNDKEALLENCRRLLKDAPLRQRLGLNAKNVVMKNQGAVDACLEETKRVMRDTVNA